MKENTSYESNKGLVVYDPGYTNTSPVREPNKLHRRRERDFEGTAGTRSRTLAEKSSYLECAFCVIYGNLPTANQLADWREAISRHLGVADSGDLIPSRRCPHDAHPMGVILAGLNALSVFHPEQKPGVSRERDLSKQRRAR